ncbi:cell division control protein, partial [Coelomomyces lativittatus]
MASVDNLKPLTLTSYVGFDTITQQIERKFLKRGFHFNIMLVGETGLGKSTFVNTLFASHLIDSKGRFKANEPPRQTTEIIPISNSIEENGVKLKLTIIDTPGFGDLLNNENCLDPIMKYIKDQYAIYLRKELTAARERMIPDSRVHCVLYFIAPTGHSLKSLDILALKQLSEITNVVPLIAKSDAMTLSERSQFKKRIQEELEYHDISIFPSEFTQLDDDPKEKAMANIIKQNMPFAIVGSETMIQGV